MINNRIYLGPRPATLALSVIVSLLGSLFAAQAATKLEIAIAGEPWKDPSISAVGTTLELSTAPSTGTLALGYQTTATHVAGVRWRVTRLNKLIAFGSVPISQTTPGAGSPFRWIFVPASFIKSPPPATPINFLITVTPYNGNILLGAPSQPVTVRQAQ